MELKELTEKTLKIFNVDEVSDLKNAIFECVMSNDFGKYISFKSLVKDLSIDWLQKIFQYYNADRKAKKQDFTPKCLAEIVSKLTSSENEKVCLDMCAGTGALTIQKWNSNNDLNFICEEFDENAIPYLLFNLAVRNINAAVLHCDVLSGEIFKTYKIQKGIDFSTVSETDSPVKINSDSVISNPPYNMKWEIPMFSQLQNRFSHCDLPPESNSNFAFILTAIDYADKVSMIMPQSILSGDTNQERHIIKHIVDENLIESIVSCPDNMFECTTIGVCLITLSKLKKSTNIMMVDMREKFDVEERKQNGQFGNKSHIARTYIKKFKSFSNEHQKLIIDTAKYSKIIPGISCSVSLEKVKTDKYNLLPSHYIPFIFKETPHREYADIVTDLNKVTKEKNCCKLIINETIAKQIGICDVFCINKNAELEKEDFWKSIEIICNTKIMKSDYIKLTKNKRELSFVNNSKEQVSTIFLSIMQMWKQHIMYLNQQENIYLSELRDALLPDLMSGKVELNDAKNEKIKD